MDIERPDLAKKNKRKKRITTALMGTGLVGAVAFFLLYDHGPHEIDRNLVFTAEVIQGDMQQKVRGVGELEPTSIRWVSATTAGRIERIYILPGAEVEEHSLILEMSNPQLLQELENANLQVATDQANFNVKKSRLESSLLQNKSTLKKFEADFKNAQLNAKIDADLYEKGLEAKQTMQRSQLLEEQLASQLDLEQERYAIAKASIENEIQVELNRLEQSRARQKLLSEQVAALQVKAGSTGLLQNLTLKEGQQVNAGQTLAQVIDPSELKALVKVPEHLAKRLSYGLSSEIDTRTGIIQGQVSRIDPNVEEGTVAVDIALTEALPPGVRPYSNVEAVIEVGRLENVVYVKRPVFSKPNAELDVFRFRQNTNIAEKVNVAFGEASVNHIEITRGLNAGDTIVLSDMSRWEKYQKLKIN